MQTLDCFSLPINSYFCADPIVKMPRPVAAAFAAAMLASAGAIDNNRHNRAVEAEDAEGAAGISCDFNKFPVTQVLLPGATPAATKFEWASFVSNPGDAAHPVKLEMWHEKQKKTLKAGYYLKPFAGSVGNTATDAEFSVTLTQYKEGTADVNKADTVVKFAPMTDGNPTVTRNEFNLFRCYLERAAYAAGGSTTDAPPAFCEAILADAAATAVHQSNFATLDSAHKKTALFCKTVENKPAMADGPPSAAAPSAARGAAGPPRLRR